MILDKKAKQPIERSDYDITYADWLRSDETLSSVVVSVACVSTPSNTSMTVTSTNSSNAVRIRCVGGTDGEEYKITIDATTTSDRLTEDEIIVRVKEE